MAIQGLTSDFAYSNIGAKSRTNKPQESCKTEHSYQSELSRKSVIQQLRSHWVSFYGRVFLRKNKTTHVFLEPLTGHTADTKKLRINKLEVFAKTNWYFITSAGSNFASSFRINKLKFAGFLYSCWANKRLRWGLLMLLVVAPASKLLYLLLPIDGFGEYFINTKFLTIPNFIETTDPEGWYFQTLYFWFWMCGELWAPLIAIYGIFLLFPKGYYPSYLVGIPFGYFFSLLVHRMLVTSTPEYHSGIGASLIVTWIILGIAIFVLSDKLLFTQNHRKRATEARIVGLINAPGIPWEHKEKMLKDEAKEWSKQENELFSRAG